MHIFYGFSDRRWGSAHKDSNLIRYLESLGVEKPVWFVRARQVHGNNIARVGKGDAGRAVPRADGLLTGEKNLFLAISAADCLPILFFDPKCGLIAAVHAGWRGTAKGIAVRAVEELSRLGSKIKNIEAIFGPCICWKHYEVGRDVVSAFSPDHPGGGLEGLPRGEFVKKGGKVFLDLREANRDQLVGAGVTQGNIRIDPRCTFEDENLYSWRREGPNLSGEIAAVIAIK